MKNKSKLLELFKKCKALDSNGCVNTIINAPIIREPVSQYYQERSITIDAGDL